MADQALYKPAPGLRTNLDSFRDYVNERFAVSLSTYQELHTFSVTRVNDFWLAVWHFGGIKASVQPRHAINDDAPMFPPPTCCPDSRMNYAENFLCGKDDAIAVSEMNETNVATPRRYTWRELRQMVAQFAGVLKQRSIGLGDVVVLIGGNSARPLALLLAAASIGAMFASFATDIGQKQLLDRVGQWQPKVIVAEWTCRYNGKINSTTSKVTTVVRRTSCQLIVVETGSETPPNGSIPLDTLVGHETADDLVFAQVPFDTPFVVMFSSGTTGTPKGIVHGQGGLVLNGIKEHMIHNNSGPQDIHCHHSGIGWTLWNISLGALFCQTTLLMYDGSPFHPSCDEFLKAVFAVGVTAYGGSPRYFSELQKRAVQPRKYAKTMHTLLSTGALLTPGTAAWLAQSFGSVCQIGFSGGTGLCGNFMTGTRSMPCYAEEIAVEELGMDVVVYGPDGRSVPDGEAGELVCKKPFPNMLVMLWNDTKMERYRKSYFSGFADDGDLRARQEVSVSGVLNPSGVRFGTSELYNILASPRFSPIVQDGLAVGQQRSSGRYSDPTERVILFLKVFPNHSTNTELLKEEIVQDLREQMPRDLSKRHVPHFFFEVDEIPHNSNGKKMEIQVEQVCNGGDQVLEKMTLTEDEREKLKQYSKSYRIEEMLKHARRTSKL